MKGGPFLHFAFEIKFIQLSGSENSYEIALASSLSFSERLSYLNILALSLTCQISLVSSVFAETAS
jgi:hypothetical protein